MISISLPAEWMAAAQSSPALVAGATLLCLAGLFLAVCLGLAILSGAKQGRIDIKVAINLGRGRRRPP